MKILKYSIRFWQLGGIYLPASSTAVDFYLNLLSIFILLSAFLVFLWLSIGYIVAEWNNVEFSQLFYSILQVCGFASRFGSYAAVVLVRGSIGKMIELLQQVVSKSTYNIYQNIKKRKIKPDY